MNIHTIGGNKGFTIIEILITSIIIAILSSIILPVLFAVKQKSQQIVCSNNLRQLFLAIEQYTNDNNGLLPRTNNSDKSRDDTKDCYTEVWFKAVDHYLISSSLPDTREEISLEERVLLVKQDPIFKNISPSDRSKTRTIKMNRNLIPDSECQRYIETIAYPTKTVLLFDGRINNKGVADNFDGTSGSVAQRHLKAANILFADGHVECIQNGDSDGTTDEGWPNRQAGQGLIWDPDNPDLP
ncbi:MAG: prepilin-type N-terminal cleavage/methylation domain-containing protein [wastewater metagenome]|nr:prepilin-type N-terminal cleavage/methylation domain-containing protein [Candidatus Loosdrechtia aerotolerans]